MKSNNTYDEMILNALKEDKPSYDVTSEWLFSDAHMGSANLIAKEELTSMLDGSEIFEFVTKDIDYEQLKDIKNVYKDLEIKLKQRETELTSILPCQREN